MAATAFHYGQESFEGLKAFEGKDGKVRIFRWEENAKRMQKSAEAILMAQVPSEVFRNTVFKAVELNKHFVPPYGSGASLYIRPLLIGSGPQVGVNPAGEYLFMVFVTPVGPYFKQGFTPGTLLVAREFDRAAPLGTGNVKVGGNYAASLKALEKAHDGGYSTVLYLDAKEKKYIDECGPANFFAIKEGKYITPKSNTILNSITNMSVEQLAKDMGLTVERRPVLFDELKDFEEVGQCGTAAVISPVGKIVDPISGIEYSFSKDGKPGPWSTKLYEKLIGIQLGDEPDTHGWVSILD
jgi:branched-chain amino acid aminotransferase